MSDRDHSNNHRHRHRSNDDDNNNNNCESRGHHRHRHHSNDENGDHRIDRQNRPDRRETSERHHHHAGGGRGDGHHHRGYHRNHDNNDTTPQQQQPRDYQSVQTQMEIISPGFNAIIDIQELLYENQELVSQIFKVKPQVKNDTNEQGAAAAASSDAATATPATPTIEKPNLLLALDFHGVVDVVTSTEEEIVPQNVAPICVVSYVGPFGPIRDQTRESIKNRIASKQVSMGIMVFKKIRDPAEKNIPEIEFIASKRHAVELLLKHNGALTKSGRILFVDDSKDNVATVETAGENRVKCALFKGKDGYELRAFLRSEM